MDECKIVRKSVYVVSTYYHALIACVKQMNEPKPTDIIVTAYIPEGEELADRIRESGLFEKTLYIGEIKEYVPKNRLDYYLNFHRRNASLIESQLQFSFSDYDDISVFHDDIWASRYFKDRRIKYHLIEDALDSFKYMSKSPFVYMLPEKGLKGKIKRKLHIGYRYGGLDSCVISIEVNEKKGTEIAACVLGKVEEISRKRLFDKLRSSDISTLKGIFAKELPEIDTSQCYLLLTRPLYEDRIVETEEKQKKYFLDLIEKNVGKGEKLIIKPHPRDGMDYTGVFPEAVIVDKNMPAEIMAYLDYREFKTIITVGKTEIREFITENYIYEVI